MSHKKIFTFSLIPLLIMPLVLCFVSFYISLPSNLYLICGDKCLINGAGLISCDAMPRDSAVSASQNADTFAKNNGGTLELYADTVGRYDAQIKFMGIIPVKTVAVEVLESGTVIPSGEAVGIKIHTDGVLVLKLSTVKDVHGKIHAPARDAGLEIGDIITKINSIKVADSTDFAEAINKSDGKPLNLELLRDGEQLSATVAPISNGEEYKIGAWIRDSTAGIGTLTFIEPSSGTFAALGHGISDRDTGSLLRVGHGSITSCEISGVDKGERGEPGQLKGILSSNDFGIITSNCAIGIYGKYDSDKIKSSAPLKLGGRFEVREGAAKILSTVDNGGTKEYDIEIERVMTSSCDEKGMIIKITDEALLEKTGGIVQGMSGSPIIQNDRLVGAVTHVFVNDPTRGYGIFIENMLSEAERVK